MTTPRFLQIHTLQSYPAALLNRDDSGLAKRLPFGGVTRTRISSQCLKRHWRVADDEWALARLDVPMGVRSRETVTRCIIAPLQTAGKYAPEVVEAIGEALQKGVYGKEGTEKAKRQPLLLGWPEVAYLRTKAEEVAQACTEAKDATAKIEELFKKESKANLSAMMQAKGTLQAGLEAALFGRMVTSDPAANTDAAIHVAHAFTVHAEESESDYFSVCEDLHQEDDDAGAAHINETELDSGLYYGYVVVDVPAALVSNLEGCLAQDWKAPGTSRELPARVVQHLCHLIAKVSPGAKLGSTAPYAYARLTLIEAGSRQPRSLANAFREPVRWERGGGTPAALERLDKEIGALDACYGCAEVRRFAAVEGAAALPGADRLVFDDLAAWAAATVRAGQA